MTRNGRRLGGFAALCLLSTVLSAAAQPPDAALMELSFTRVAVWAGEEAALPIYLVSESNYHEPFQITLEFSADQLSFQKIQSAYLADRAKWTMGATLKNHPEKGNRRILQIDVTPGQATFFPSGAVAHAHFLVAAGSRDGDILLDAALVAPLSASPVPTPGPAKITVISALLYGCFFYMH